MAIIKAKGSQTSSVSRLSEGADVFVRATRDGSLVTTPWLMQMVIEGRVFGVNVGILTTPQTLNATIADGEPDLLVNVPSGTTIIPVYLSVDFEDTGTAQVMDVLAVSSPVYDNANTSTALTIRNLRTDNPFSSQCSAMAVVTGSGTALETGNYFEFWRPYAGFAEDGFNGSTSWGNNALHGVQWKIGEAMVPPVIVGQGSMGVFASAQAGTGFVTAIWVELPTTAVT